MDPFCPSTTLLLPTLTPLSPLLRPERRSCAVVPPPLGTMPTKLIQSKLPVLGQNYNVAGYGTPSGYGFRNKGTASWELE